MVLLAPTRVATVRTVDAVFMVVQKFYLLADALLTLARWGIDNVSVSRVRRHFFLGVGCGSGGTLFHHLLKWTDVHHQCLAFVIKRRVYVSSPKQQAYS